MKYACIGRYEECFTIVLMCRVLAVSRTGYYAWRARGPSRREQTDVGLRLAIRAAHTASQRRYGSPRIHRELRGQAWRCSRKRIARLMQLEGLRGKRGRRYRTTTQADGTPPAPNRLARQFRVPALNQVWVSDVTACATAGGWLYLAVVLDLASRRVIGWAVDRGAGQALTLAALRRALVTRRPTTGLLHHSDRGAHYTAAAYQHLLVTHGITASMSRTGDCWDNAVVESFFATLKGELLVETTWQTRREVTAALHDYIRWYNDHRLHSTLGYCSPASFEAQLTAA